MDMGIGELSRRVRINVETIRYYEREGLIEPPPRSAGGHRRYGDTALRRLRFVRRARELGFTLSDVRELLALSDEPRCAEVERLTRRHHLEVQRKIADLRKLERTLKHLASSCRRGRERGCPVIDALTGSPREPLRSTADPG